MQTLEEVDALVRFTSLVIVRGRLVHAGPVGEPKELAKKIREALSDA
jgi:hypothetical protein